MVASAQPSPAEGLGWLAGWAELAGALPKWQSFILVSWLAGLAWLAGLFPKLYFGGGVCPAQPFPLDWPAGWAELAGALPSWLDLPELYFGSGICPAQSFRWAGWLAGWLAGWAELAGALPSWLG